MNSNAWKWILTGSCLIAAPAALAASNHINLHNPMNQATHQQHKLTGLDKSKFQYMDSVPVFNTNHVRAAVMVFEKKDTKTNRCASLTGGAKHRCYELSMPT
jgi:hypothetical protein